MSSNQDNKMESVTINKMEIVTINQDNKVESVTILDMPVIKEEERQMEIVTINQDTNKVESVTILDMPVIKEEERQTPSWIPAVNMHYIRNIFWIFAGLVAMCFWLIVLCGSLYVGFQYLFAAVEIESPLFYTAGYMSLTQAISMYTIFFNWWWVTWKPSRNFVKRNTRRCTDYFQALFIIFAHVIICIGSLWMILSKMILIGCYAYRPPTISPDRMSHFLIVGAYGLLFNIAYMLHMMNTFRPADIPANRIYKLTKGRAYFAIVYCIVYNISAMGVGIQLILLNYLNISESSKVFMDYIITLIIIGVIWMRIDQSLLVYNSIFKVQQTLAKLIVAYHEEKRLDKNNIGKRVRLRVNSSWLHMHQHEVLPVKNIHGMEWILASVKKLKHGPEHKDIELIGIDGIFTI